MTTYAHIETGQILDPHQNASAQEYLSRYASGSTSGWNVKLIPDLDTGGNPVCQNATFITDGSGNVISVTNQQTAVVPQGIKTDFGKSEFIAAIQRQASSLAKKGQYQQALFLLKKNGL